MKLTLFSVQMKSGSWKNLDDSSRKVFAILGNITSYSRFRYCFRNCLEFSDEYDMHTVRWEGEVGAFSEEIFKGTILDISGNLEVLDTCRAKPRYREELKMKKMLGES